MGNLVNRFAFHPPEPATYTQELSGLIFINSTNYTASNALTDVLDIPAVFHERPSDRPGKPYTILFSHGNAEDIGGELQKWLIFLSTYLDVNVISFEYSGFGLNKQTLPSEKSCYDNILTIWNFLTKTKCIPPECVILMGRSIGSGPSVHLAAQLCRQAKRAKKRIEWLKTELAKPKYRVDWYHFKRLRYQKELAEQERTALELPGAIILQSAIASCIRIVSNALAVLPIDLFTNIKKMKKISCPILIVHGTDDQVVPFRHSTLLWQACAPNKWRFLPILQAGHNNIENYQLFRDQLLAAIQDLINEMRAHDGEVPPQDLEESPLDENSYLESTPKIVEDPSSAPGSVTSSPVTRLSVSSSLGRRTNDNKSDEISRFLIRTKMIEVDDDIADIDEEPQTSIILKKNNSNIDKDNDDESRSKSEVFEDEMLDEDDEEVHRAFITVRPQPLLPSCLFYSKMKIGLRSQVNFDDWEDEKEITKQPSAIKIGGKEIAIALDRDDSEDDNSRDYDETLDPDEALGRNLFKFTEFDFSSDEEEED